MVKRLRKRKSSKDSASFYDRKAADFESFRSDRERIKWYLDNFPQYKGPFLEKHPDFKIVLRIEKILALLRKLKHLSKKIDFMRWYIIDFLSGKQRRFWGIYQFVALPGEGKTMSMVAHAERARAAYPDVIIGANFSYAYAEYFIEHWLDIIKISKIAQEKHCPCLILMDEIHVTFDSSDWKSFPAELLALLSFNRKFSLQFLCSAQIYERIPKKIRDIANYTVICKNVLGADRYFRCYYYTKEDYDASFNGKRADAKFIREFIADDNFYDLYNTLEQVDRMKLSAQEEKDKREEALAILFDNFAAEAAEESADISAASERSS